MLVPFDPGTEQTVKYLEDLMKLVKNKVLKMRVELNHQ